MEFKDAKDFNVINPVDYYNIYHSDDAIEIFSNLRKVKKIGDNSFTIYDKNTNVREQKVMITIFGNFLITEENSLGLKKGFEYTPFMIMQMFKFKNSWDKALNYVKNEKMGIKHNYIRVGIKYYKVHIAVDRYNIKRKSLILWDKQTIVDDNGKDFLSTIPKYDNFIIEPDNINYKQVINNNYNLYNSFSFKPTDVSKEELQKNIKWSMRIVKHIFGSQYELGLKYMKVLYEHPDKILPILVLVSKQRGTGKTTFVNWISSIFGDNSIIVNPRDIGSDFNGGYANKNIIMVEESKFKNPMVIEKIKNLVTQKKILVNTKFVQQYSLPFYGKIIITSNDGRKFSQVDKEEIRYWVRKIKLPKKSEYNNNIEQDLVKEIPYFLQYLKELPPIDFSKSRMVFTPEEIETTELRIVKDESRPELQKDIEFLLEEHCENNYKIKDLYFTASDLKTQWFKNNSKISISYIYKILTEFMKLEKTSKTTRYIPLETNEFQTVSKKSGRPFVYKNDYCNDE